MCLHDSMILKKFLTIRSFELFFRFFFQKNVNTSSILILLLFVPHVDHHVVRNYSLSSGPNKDFYRISIKKEAHPETPPGLVSNYFHQNIVVGSKIEMIVPCGSFVLKDNDRPIILISGTT